MQFLMPLAFLSCGLLVSAANGQTLRDLRHGYSLGTHATTSGSRTDSLLVAPRANVLTWTWWTSSGTGRTSVTLPYAQFAVGALRPTPDADRYLLCGLSGTLGVLAVVRIDITLGTVAVEQQVTLPGRDILDVVFNAVDGRVYVISGGEHAVLSAPWSSVTAPLPTAFTTAVGPAQVSLLDQPERVILGVAAPDGTQGFALQYDGLTIDWFWVRQVGGSWVATPRTLRDMDPAAFDGWSVEDATYADVRMLRVRGGAAGSFSIVTGNTVVGSGTTTAPHQGVDVVLSPPLIAGAQYRVVGSPLRDSASFRPAYRYGAPLVVGGLDPGRANLAASEFYVGSTIAPVSLRGTRMAATSAPVTYEAALWMAGTPSNFASPPIVQAGNVAILIPDAVVPVPLAFKADDRTGKTGWLVSVPADLGLQGALLWFQFLVACPDGSVAVSDVVATSILSPPTTAARSARAGRGPGSRAAQAWIRLDGETERAAAERRRVLEWTRQVWRQVSGR